MEDRRKIVIPTGVDPEETLSQRYFDTEATLAARPVVPLPDAATDPAAAHGNTRRWLLPAVVTGAIVIGIGAGFAISGYARRRPAETPVAVRAVADKPRSTLPWTHTPDEPLAVDDSTAAVADPDEVTAPPEDINTHAPVPPQSPPRADETGDKKRAREEAARETRDDRRDQLEQEREERASDDRERRQDERRRRRGRDDKNRDDDLPQDPITRHTRDGLHRVREIFEGTP